MIEVLKEIEKQTKYTFTFDDAKFLTSLVTIKFDQTPLNRAFARLLKEQNYSVICNDKQKNITLVFFAKSNTPIALKGSGGSKESSEVVTDPKTHDMAGVSVALAEYNRITQMHPVNPVPRTRKTPMDDATAALEEYLNNVDNQVDPMPKGQGSPMDEATAAFEEYQNNVDNRVDPMPKGQGSPMDEATAAFEEHKRNMDNSVVSSITQTLETSMDGATAAFEEYDRLLKEGNQR